MLYSVLVLLLYAVPLWTRAVEVKLGNTTLIGRDSAGVDFFGGIPYAEPPVGHLRLAAPVLKTTLEGDTFNASSYGAWCLQPGTVSSEDCLTLNVYRPPGIPNNASLPVMAWVHGSGFKVYSSALFNGTMLVAQSISRGTPVILVTLNYRLGPLGFPAGNEADRRGALNLGMKDILAALEWIQSHIASFGGDPNKVTIFGQSAGSAMTALLYLNSNLDSLVRAAIMESGGAGVWNFEPARHQSIWNDFISALPECAGSPPNGAIDCLRTNATTESIQNAMAIANNNTTEQFPWEPTIDGPNGLIPDLPSKLLEKGQFARIPFMTGANLDEGTFATPLTVTTDEDVRQNIFTNWSDHTVAGDARLETAITRLLELYPDNPALGSPYNTGNETFGLSSQFKRLSAIVGDIQFHSQRRSWIQAASKAGVKTYGYLFTDPVQFTAPPNLGVVHGSEVMYLFGDFNTLSLANAPGSSKKLSAQMIDYWVSFATSLDPNDGLGTARPLWPQYTDCNQTLLELNGNNLTVIPDTYRKKQIGFIQANAETFRH